MQFQPAALDWVRPTRRFLARAPSHDFLFEFYVSHSQAGLWLRSIRQLGFDFSYQYSNLLLQISFMLEKCTELSCKMVTRLCESRVMASSGHDFTQPRAHAHLLAHLCKGPCCFPQLPNSQKKALLLSSFFLFFYGLLSAIAPSFGWIAFLRFLVGTMIGCVPQSVTLFSEFLPTRQGIMKFNAVMKTN